MGIWFPRTAAAGILYPDGVPEIYTLKNFALSKVDGDTTYAEYVAAHSSEWTNIMTNLGFYWADASGAASEPDCGGLLGCAAVLIQDADVLGDVVGAVLDVHQSPVFRLHGTLQGILGTLGGMTSWEPTVRSCILTTGPTS